MAPTFAQATTAQNIGDVAGNTRVSFPAIGTGVAGNSLKLALAKNGSPSSFLRVRIETDNGGSPSGTLVDANATKDIDPATLTTSLADTTVTFPGSFTIANGTKVHTVVSAVGDVVNASNYYKIGYSTNDTTTRGDKFYNGTVWADNPFKSFASNFSQTYTTTTNNGYYYGCKITVDGDFYIKSITANNGGQFNACNIYSSTGSLIETGSVSGGTVTFTGNTKLISSEYYKVLFYVTNAINLSAIGASSSGYVNVVGGYDSIATPSGGESSYCYMITSIVGIGKDFSVGGNLSFLYISSILFHNTVLSLTDADFAYKASLYGISTALASIGTYPKLTVFGVSNNFTGMTEGGTQYLGPTPGGIQSTAGTNSFVVGKSMNSTKLRVKDLIS